MHRTLVLPYDSSQRVALAELVVTNLESYVTEIFWKIQASLAHRTTGIYQVLGEEKKLSQNT